MSDAAARRATAARGLAPALGAIGLMALGAAGLWIGSLAIWAIIPKSLGFFYYYYPSAIFLSIALALALRPLAGKRGRRFRTGFMLLSAALFVYFYPILSAMPLNGERAFTRWIWFRGWI